MLVKRALVFTELTSWMKPPARAPKKSPVARVPKDLPAYSYVIFIWVRRSRRLTLVISIIRPCKRSYNQNCKMNTFVIFPSTISRGSLRHKNLYVINGYRLSIKYSSSSEFEMIWTSPLFWCDFILVCGGSNLHKSFRIYSSTLRCCNNTPQKQNKSYGSMINYLYG